MIGVKPTQGPILAAADERAALLEIEKLVAHASPWLRLVDETGAGIALPESLTLLLGRMVQALARDRAVDVVSFPRELSLGEAADLLDVSVQTLTSLIEQGAVPTVTREGYRRIRFEDLVELQTDRDAARRAGLDELTRLSQELGLYSARKRDPVPTPR